MFTLTLSQLEPLRSQGRHVVLESSLSIDTETPVSLYYKLCHDRAYSFLFESATPDAQRGRYSFIGFDPVEVFRFDADDSRNPLDVLRAALAALEVIPTKSAVRFNGGLVGYFSYESLRHFESISFPSQSAPIEIPESIFFLPRILLVHDHYKSRLTFHYLFPLGGDLNGEYAKAQTALEQVLQRLSEPVSVPALDFLSDGVLPEITFDYPGASQFMKNVEVAKEFIRAGEVFQLVLSQSLCRETVLTPLDLYRRLRQKSPSPYMYFLNMGVFSIVGASPETLVQLEEGRVTVRPIAGTRPRGISEVEDDCLEAELMKDLKELAEHRMLIDLARNDVGRVAESGTVNVPRREYVQRFASVMHLISDVIGRLKSELDMFDVYRVCFPAGTLSGAPKLRAIELIARLEGRRRGLYGGSVGYFGFNGNMDFAIAIRTFLQRGKRVCLQVGAGIVYDSTPEREYQECVAKARSTLAVLQ
jgi:anthranilate synthase component 1